MTKHTFELVVRVVIDDSCASSEFNAIKRALTTVRGLKETIIEGFPTDDREFRDIDPMKLVNIRVRKLDGE